MLRAAPSRRPGAVSLTAGTIPGFPVPASSFSNFLRLFFPV